jgi:predicted  nucleic acid-binding Zn-ribbon protein
MPLAFVDRLHERGWVDRWAFLLFAFAGIIGIPLAKGIGLSAMAVALGALIVMVLFAAIQDRSGTGRVRSDQAGDNCYYLGLVYTLASLAYTIFVFDPGDSATTIVQGFGVALATTVVGLILRVFFNQSRTDLAEVEDTTRIELADAAGRLKGELSQISVSLNDMVRQIRQAMEEMRHASVDQVRAATAASAESIGQVASQASALLQAHDAELGSSLKRLRSASDKTVASLDGHAQVLGSISEASASFSQAVASLRGTTAATEASIKSVGGTLAEVKNLHAGMQTSGSRLQETAISLSTAVSGLAARLTDFDRSTSDRMDELRNAPVRGVEEAAEQLKQSLATVSDDLQRLLTAQATASETLSSAAAAAVQVTERHNAALEAELTRSRDNVAKVHSNLVTVTAELVRQVEQKVQA